MDKRYQVFVSSTFTDLVEERRQVMQALLKLNCIPAGMELFNATNEDQWDLIKRVIDDSDYYVVIVGARYGSMTEEGISYTEKEYDYAVSLGKNVLGFVHAKPGSIAVDKAELSVDGRRKLAAFVEKVEGKPVVRWESAAELAGQVGLSVASEMTRFPAVGWVRGDQAMTPETEAEISNLRARLAEVELHEAQAVASSGFGLTEHELDELAQGSDTLQIEAWFGRQLGSRVMNLFAGVKIDVSWDALFRSVGPALINEASDAVVKDRVEAASAVVVTEEDAWPDKSFEIGLQVDQAFVDQVVVQLRALSLIDKGTKKRAVSDTATYWKLTDRGDRYLAKLMAIKRP